YDLAVATETSLPQSVVENYDVILSCCSVFQHEVSSELRLDPEHRKEVRRNRGAADQFRSVASAPTECSSTDCRHILKHRVPRAPVWEVGRRCDVAKVPLAWPFLVEADELPRFAVGQRIEQNSLPHAEDCRVRPDSQSQSGKRHDRETGVTRQSSKA